MFRPRRETPLRYQETSDGLAELAAKTFVIDRDDREAIVLKGTCPRCGGTMTVFEPAKLLFRSTDTAEQTELPESGGRPIPIWCSAKLPCEGRPEGVVQGCGGNWTLIV